MAGAAGDNTPWWADYPVPGVRQDFPRPPLEETSANQRASGDLSQYIKDLPRPEKPLKVCANSVTDFADSAYLFANMICIVFQCTCE